MSLDELYDVVVTRSLDRSDLAAVSPALLLTLAVAGVALAVWPPSWRVLGHVVTVVHEIGHAFAALTVGRLTTGIVLRSDMSGETATYGRGGRVTSAWVSWWGYPAPAVFGAGLTYAAGAGWAGAAATASLALLALAILLSRSLVTLLVLGATTAVVGGVYLLAPPIVLVVASYGLGFFLVVGSLRGLWSVTRVHAPGRREEREHSDALALARLTLLPSVLWLATFLAAAGASALVALSTLGSSL